VSKEAVRSAGIPAGVFSSSRVESHIANGAAFFDLDGTLLPAPSLEHRFWNTLRYRKQIGVRHHLAWLLEALRLLPSGIGQLAHANKAYLRGVRAADVAALVIPPFFPEALQRVQWHAQQGHCIVIVSGTLEPLAARAAGLLETELAAHGIRARVEICATRLATVAGVWTGRIHGEAMFGEAKARAVQRFCLARNIAPEKCFAYGDSANDRWMLEAVRRPTTVNPSDDLSRIARRNGWPIVRWTAAGVSTPSARSSWSGANSEMSDHEIQIAAPPERECWR